MGLIIMIAMVFFLVAPLSMSTMADFHVLGVMAISELVSIATLFFIGTDNGIREKVKTILSQKRTRSLIDKKILRIFDLNRLAALTGFGYPLFVLWNEINLTVKLVLIIGCGAAVYIWREGYKLFKS